MDAPAGGPDSKQRWHLTTLADAVRDYGIATAIVIIAAVARWLIGFVGDGVLAFPTFYPAVLFATLIAGMGPGLWAALLGGLVGYWAFVVPEFALLVPTRGQQVGLLIYFLACSLIVWGADRYRRVNNRLREQEKSQELMLMELAHRLKNKLATIHAIVSYQLRDQPQVKNDIIGRLMVLSATDDLILDRQGKGAQLRDIMTSELRPYDAARFTARGPELLLPPRLAVVWALLIHELATNAAKYGAFSNPAGRLSVDWSTAEAKLTFLWKESGGPAVTPPTRGGFGMTLMSGLLAQFGGTIDTRFDPRGFSCTLVVPLPEGISGEPSEATGLFTSAGPANLMAISV